jgi:hypothetical protein
MKFYKSAILVAAMLLGFSSVASATFFSGHYHHGCGDNGSPSLCEKYSETFKVDSFNKSNDGNNTFYASFDAITQPNLTIESAYLTIKSNSDGKYDTVYAQDAAADWRSADLDYIKQTFILSDSLFDDILSGLNVAIDFQKLETKLVSSNSFPFFDLITEKVSDWSGKVFWAELTVNGEYCPPVSEVPVPAALWLFGSGLMGFTAMRRRKKTA